MVSISGLSGLEIRDQTSLSQKLCEQRNSVLLVVAYIAGRSDRPDGRAVIQLTKHERINYCNKYVFSKYMFNLANLP